MASNFAWGIDVGNRALKAVKLVRENDQLKVDDFELIEHETVLSNAGDNKESLIQSALANFVQRHPFKGGQVAIGVSGQSSFARFIKLPPVEPKKIPEIVRFEAIQQIPFPLDDVEWSYQLFQHPDSPDVEVGIFAMRKELVASQIKQYTDFDLNVQVVQMNPLAVYNAMYNDRRFSGTTMVVDLGAENTDLIIADNETIWMRSIPIGGNNFTETLVKAFKLPFPKAEELKRNAATSKYARQIFQAMRPIFADLVAEIQRSVGFYASVHRDSRIRKVIAIGGTFKLPGLQKYLQQNLQLDVERLDTIAAPPSEDGKLAPTFNENILSMISAYGLAIQAMGDGKITSSLLPEKIRREKMWKEKIPLFGAAAALFVVGAGISYGTYWLNKSSMDSSTDDRSRITNVLAEAKDLDSQWSTIESAGGPERTTISNVHNLLTYRTFWGRLLSDIQGALPQARDATKKAQPQIFASDPATIKQVPRAQRNQIFIQSLSTQYLSDIGTALASADLSQFAPAGTQGQPAYPGGAPSFPGSMQYGADPTVNPEFNQGQSPSPSPDGSSTPSGSGQRGYLITLHCVSPNANTLDLINKELIPALLAVKPDPNNPARRKLEYSIPKVSMVRARQVKDDPALMQKIRNDYEAALLAQILPVPGSVGAPAQPGFYPGANQPGMYPGAVDNPEFRPATPGGFVPPNQGGSNMAPEDPTPYMDRRLNEDVREDWAVTLLVLVQIDPPPPEPAGGQQAAAQ